MSKTWDQHYVTCTCDESGAIYQSHYFDGNTPVMATVGSYEEAERIRDANVINGVRGPGCMGIYKSPPHATCECGDPPRHTVAEHNVLPTF